MIRTDDSYIRGLIRRRKEDAHKGDFGKVLIYAGSPGMAGAAVLCGRAALKSGAGLVQFLLSSPADPLLNILQISVPEATCIFRNEHPDLTQYAAIIAGSGLGTDPDTDGPDCGLPSRREILTYILRNYSRVLVLDADALNMIARDEDLADQVRASKARIIITPHIGEARRLLHTEESLKGPDSRQAAACSLAERYRCIAVLKGAGTLVSFRMSDAEEAPLGGPSFFLSRNTTGNPGMATAGSGDSLAGLIGSLAAQGYPAPDAARAGVFIHGKAGDLAALQQGEMGMTASDIVAWIPEALKQYYPER